MKRTFLNYNKQELIDKIDLISIELVGNQVVTKYRDTVTSISNVSTRYEIFDIKSYLKTLSLTNKENYNKIQREKKIFIVRILCYFSFYIKILLLYYIKI